MKNEERVKNKKMVSEVELRLETASAPKAEHVSNHHKRIVLATLVPSSGSDLCGAADVKSAIKIWEEK